MSVIIYLIMNPTIVPIAELDAPKILYKFRDLSNKKHIETLFNDQMYIPSVNTFNDPQDSKIPFRYPKGELTKENIMRKCQILASELFPNKDQSFKENVAYDMYKRNQLLDKQYLEDFDRKNYQKLNNDFGIMCLTPKVKNFLMWSYYSNSHTGFCIGYDTQKLIECEIFSMGGKVIYTNQFPTFPLFPDYKNTDVFLKIFYMKSKVWKHENEYRLMHMYKKGKVHAIDKSLIKEIVIGCAVQEKTALDFTQKILKSFPNVSIYRMRLKSNAFGLKKESIYDQEHLLNFKTLS